MSNVFAQRRQRFMDTIGPGAVAIIGGHRLTQRNSDVEYRFRQSSDLLFLTGFSEPDSLAVIAPGRQEKFTLFVRPRDAERETWTGRRAGVEGAVSSYGADRALNIEELERELPNLLNGADDVLFVPGEDRWLDEIVLKALAHLRAAERRGLRAPERIVDLRASLHELRLFKDDDALGKLRRAVAISAEAHVAAMKAARAGVRESEIEALIDYTFRRHGGLPGYNTIVGGGVNATILHYIDNQDPLVKGQLLLIDAGCEFEGFTADITRTFPVGSRFSPGQRQAYEMVLEVQKRCIASVRSGATIDGIHQIAVEGLTQGMVDLGLLKGQVPELLETGQYRKFYMHRTSHWLGLDVHDVGAYTEKGKPRPLLPGMVLTIEPGLYVRDDEESAPPELRGLGIRIEDDVLVTTSGPDVLTQAVPKEVDDLERITAAA